MVKFAVGFVMGLAVAIAVSLIDYQIRVEAQWDKPRTPAKEWRA